MAIDTKAKRMNMLYVASPVTWVHLFEIDGAVDADDRAHLLHVYGGNALDSPVGGRTTKNTDSHPHGQFVGHSFSMPGGPPP